MRGLTGGVVELDLHGMTQVQAKAAVDAALRRAGGSVYRLRVIHGYRGGTQLRDMAAPGVRETPQSEAAGGGAEPRGHGPGPAGILTRRRATGRKRKNFAKWQEDNIYSGEILCYSLFV